MSLFTRLVKPPGAVQWCVLAADSYVLYFPDLGKPNSQKPIGTLELAARSATCFHFLYLSFSIAILAKFRITIAYCRFPKFKIGCSREKKYTNLRYFFDPVPQACF